MFTDATTFRPRNGLPAECYWRIRHWCDTNGFAFSDVLNALMAPVAYYLENHCVIDHDRQMAKVILNIGELPIYHVLNGRLYPLRRELDAKNTLQVAKIEKALEYWKERNATQPCLADLQLLDSHRDSARTSH
jgi:hypothetical protein